MRVVVDTNRIIAALVKDGISREIILHFDGELITIGFSKEELGGHLAEILDKTGLSQTDLDMILEKLFSKITVLDDRVIEKYLDKANTIMKKIDPSDAPFIAAALATNSSIWSDDKHFKKQSIIRVITTKEMVGLYKSKH